jgi:hypothetical protein
MAIKDWFRGRGEVSQLSNLRIGTEFLDAEYEIFQWRTSREAIRAFSLIPKTSGPSFHARVHDGSPKKRKEPDFDIDIVGVSAAAARDFKAGRNGYSGHHNDLSPSPSERIFDVKIAIPNRRVFEGQVSFSMRRFQKASPSASSRPVTLGRTVTRAGSDKKS